ncbi:uncharacterized protein LOC128254573 [Drosophila gunungcola]|uniref:LITAF domain-containing protein n=1 Tax=Drosophila gunungcola TaxID=103775 RepID=A0A9Q0BNM9_9MUSC|nr:uncharacterized protein LOC128254573 [Drosophila gunungcola]XP_052839689.1 uncharacterized protein LOC128254573 [Drosophila gunungcola]KAI8038511.1 hypothetical protein M5D96_008411 [Drosophila gunungcola]
MSQASPATGDMQSLRCLHCMKVIRCSRYDTSGLVRHIEQDHPDIYSATNDKIKNLHKLAADHGISEERLTKIGKMTGLSETEMAEKADKYMASKMSSGRSGVSGVGEPVGKTSSKAAYSAASSKEERSSGPCPCPCPRAVDKTAHRRHCYRASIERWAPVEGRIFCPCCACSRRPLIKAATEIMDSGCCASCLLTCWPLCFLPCLQSADNREYLYCSNCRTFLGIYDRDHNCVNPSKEFVSCTNSATPPPKPPLQPPPK